MKRRLEIAVEREKGPPRCGQVVRIPIPILPFAWVSPPIYLDPIEQETVHENLFFEDGLDPPNLGFFDTDSGGEVKPDDALARFSWSCKDCCYDDCVMRRARQRVAQLGGFEGHYRLTGVDHNNCQDWAEAVRRAYRELE